mmetsp:Transcript_26366/g.49539  ORF Transcript_26366/g.49539 Transcript_26366/m.49539 type:complete len:302 (-) Transcript_26366:395-1300(-)
MVRRCADCARSRYLHIYRQPSDRCPGPAHEARCASARLRRACGTSGWPWLRFTCAPLEHDGVIDLQLLQLDWPRERCGGHISCSFSTGGHVSLYWCLCVSECRSRPAVLLHCIDLCCCGHSCAVNLRYRSSRALGMGEACSALRQLVAGAELFRHRDIWCWDAPAAAMPPAQHAKPRRVPDVSCHQLDCLRTHLGWIWRKLLFYAWWGNTALDHREHWARPHSGNLPRRSSSSANFWCLGLRQATLLNHTCYTACMSLDCHEDWCQVAPWIWWMEVRSLDDADFAGSVNVFCLPPALHRAI